MWYINPMADDQKIPQNQDQIQDTLIPSSSSIGKEKELPIPVDAVPSMKLDEEVERGGVEVVENPEIPPHEIIKDNLEIPTPQVPQPLETVQAKHPVKAKIVKMKKGRMYTNPREADAWIEEEEEREGMKKAA